MNRSEREWTLVISIVARSFRRYSNASSCINTRQ